MKKSLIKIITLLTCLSFLFVGVCACDNFDDSLYDNDDEEEEEERNNDDDDDETTTERETTTSESRETRDTTRATTQATTQTTTQTTATTPTTTASSGIVVSTSWFSITLPASWQKLYVSETYVTSAGTVGLSIYQAASHTTDFPAGSLFSITLFPADEDFTVIPEFTYLGTYTYYDGTMYSVVAIFPSDVQFTEDTQAEYQSMFSQANSIFATFVATPGVGTYSAA